MAAPILTVEQLQSASAAEVEAQVRKDAQGLDPATIETIVALVLRFGPSLYAVILKLFHVTPKS